MDSIKKLLTVPYNQETFKKFAINFLKDVVTVPLRENTIIPLSFRSTIESYTIFGQYTDNNGKRVVIISVKVKNNSSAQKAQRQFISYLLANEFIGFNAALVAYYDKIRENWKLSFVTIEYNFGEKGIELKFKPAKRFSFLVGKDEPTKTYVQQLEPIYDSLEKPSLSRLNEAFSVNRLTKDFYVMYREKFEELTKYLVKNKAFIEQAKSVHEKPQKYAVTFAKKTLGQIVFLFFVQKKGWIGVPKDKDWGQGDKDYIFHSTKSFNGSNYFEEFLEPLFYDALNSKRDDDIFMGAKVPFLNGGLFHPLDNYDWRKTEFGIPNEFWFNQDESGFIDLLSQYNFTVDESDPSEQEIAIDPEMLGRIFESLLDIESRKNKGAFYTPRNIVQNMCIEALANRICSHLDLDFDSIVSYIRYGDALKERDFIEAFAKDIDEYLATLTIVDPAVGSGAFLVGMMTEITKLRLSLQHVYLEEPQTSYEIKMNCIQNTLYGVDLEYDAIEIAKLRLWLSLLVDQQIEGSAPAPLPNLNFHLRTGNSLFQHYEGIELWNDNWNTKKRKERKIIKRSLFDYEWIDDLIESIKIDKKLFFRITDDTQKTLKLDEIERKQIDLITSLLERDGKTKEAEKLSSILKEKSKPFFIWKLEFMEVFENGGFDIVIGNPPYISTKGVDNSEKPSLKEEYGFADDTYSHFYFLGMKILKDNGNISFITSKSFWTTQTKKNLRELLLKYKINYIFDTANPFEAAMVDTCIIFANKLESDGTNLIKFYDGKESFDNPKIYEVRQSIYLNANNQVIFIPTDSNIKIYNQFNNIVSELYRKWWGKISTSKNITKNKKELSIYRESLKPGDVTLLGCLTDGGVGLQTGNNGKYIAVRKCTKWADNIINTRPKKLKEAIAKYNITELESVASIYSYLNSLSEKEIAELFDSLKEKYGRDIFGQGYLYKIVNEEEIANINDLTDDEKENGISEKKPHYVLYDKGDKDGNRWYLKTPFVISWTKENVHLLKTDKRARYQGYMYFFKEGFCWSDINTTYLKCRIKEKSVNDVKSMSLYGLSCLCPESYLISIINSTFISLYVDSFINNTQTFQINDARQLPIIIPTDKQLKEINTIFEEAIQIKKLYFNMEINYDQTQNKLEILQNKIDQK